jgi:hypothetical protein
MTDERYTLSVSYVPPDASRENDDFVLLEQEELSSNVNKLTITAVAAEIANILGGGYDYTENCAPPRYHVYAYPSRDDLQFIVGASYGTLSEPVTEDKEFTEFLQVNLETELTPKYPIHALLTCRWLGDVYGPEGDIVSPPGLAIDGKIIRVDAEVYGTVVVEYAVYRLSYGLDIVPRPGAIENRIQSWVYACWDGGNVKMEMKFPEGADEDECANKRDGDGGTVEPSKDVPCVSPTTEEVYSDWCDQKV